MAKLYISEFSEIVIRNGAVSIARQPAMVDQAPIAIGAGAVLSDGFGAATSFIRVHTDAICSIKIGTTPVATANSARMAAGATEYFGVSPGDKLSVITNT